MIIKFEKYKLNENPDYVHNYHNLNYSDDDAVAFFIDVNENITKVDKLYYLYSKTHGDILYDILGNYSLGRGDNEWTKTTYPGRLWINKKIITFWVYPNQKLFVDIVRHLERELNINIFNNNWKVEVVKDDKNKIVTTDYNGENLYRAQWKGDNYEDFIPIEDYAGSANQPEEKRLWHLMNAEEKRIAKLQGKAPDFKGWGSDMTAWDGPNPLWWRQAKYQENKKFNDN